jgi:amino acid adenylation domain-containing protein
MPVTAPANLVTPDNLAYVIYTSGSTGTPKGAMITHRGLSNYLNWATQTYPIEPGRGVPVHSPIGFDLTVTGLFAPLIVGGFVDLLNDNDPVSTLRTAVVGQPGYSFVKLTPAHLELLSNELNEIDLHKTTDALIVGGEALTTAQIANWQERAPGVRIFNEYGPTETVVGCCVYEVGTAEQVGGVVPIGRPIANTQLYILDQELQPAPIGVPGELFIGGIGVARGYLNRPDLTAAAFVPNPFSTEPGARLYRTGDIARYRADGVIEYIGRRDTQVKFNGYRIELGEIEATLQSHPGVESAVVMLREDTPGNKRLVAYVVQAANNDAPQAGQLDYELRRWLSQRLPAHMAPNTYVALDTLPLTANGKINRRALPAPSMLRPDLRAAFVAPRTPIEARITTIWAETLGLEKVGIYDDFFELGGHSLLAARVMARLSDAFGVSLPMRSLFLEPTVAHLATLIAATPSEQPETKEQSSSPASAIVPDAEARYQPFALTDVQQAYWVGRVGAIELGNIATHSYREYELIDLRIERFNWAWQQLIERHDALRIVFLPDGQQQVLSSVPAYQIPVHDLRGLEPAVVQERLAALRDELSHQMLPPDRWPLFDIQVSLLDDRRAIVHYSFDALICDAWSRRILMRELTTLYNNAEAALPPLELRFRDYVLAEEQFKHAEDYQKSLAYWRNRLATLPHAPDLPLARDPSEITQPHFTRRSMTLAPEVWQQLKSRGARLRLTPSGVILAVFAEILATWSKSPHFTINLTLFNRLPLHPQINDIVGDFTSLTLLEIDYTSGSFETRAARVQQQLWNDLDHRNVSGVQVLRELSRAQGQGLRALMPVVFTSTLALHQNAEQTEAPVLLRNERYAISQTPQVWLDHHLIEQDGQLILNWDVVEELFPAGMLDAMFQGYRSLLHQLAEDETLWHGHIHDVVLTEQLAEYAAINATDWPLTNDLLHSGFLRQVQAQPQHPALVAGARTLSYGELYQQASQVAQWLRSCGARPNTLVAVVMDKGWEQVVAVLGAVMAGAAYLPVDSNLPTERRLYVLEHSQASLVLTQSWLDLHQEWPVTLHRLSVDQLEGQAAGVKLAGEPLQQPDDLAYVIYTSGSTGMPKGVAINHRGPVNTIYDLNDRFAIAPSDRVLALSSLSFDLSVYDIFGTLAAGATIVLPDADTTRDPGKLAALIEREQITLWNSVPALMGLLCEYLSERQLNLPESLRLFWFSGDWIPLNLPDQVRALGNDLQVIGMGGATEASIWSIIYPIGAVDPAWKSIPYGQPMRNQRFYVLNAALDPCPVWVQGELYIGGVGLAQGYWHDTEKTNASFMYHPCSGERLYRTGDLGRYLPDGNIEFLGRADSQVKIQGYRIELGEIESVLAQHPAVRNAVVLALGERHAEKRLVAYIVLQPGQSLSSSAVRQFLHEKLPAYMVPSAVMFLATLPLTGNDKVDRKALSTMPLTLELNGVEAAPQQLGLSTQVVQFIAELLKIKSLDLDTNLLEIGANSIDIIRIANQCEQRFGIRPTLRDLYTTPSVRGVTALLEQQLQPTPVPAEEATSPTPALDTALISAPGYSFEPLDPQEYAAFRAQQHHLRHDLVAQPAVQLEPAGLDAAAQEQVALRASVRRFAMQAIPSRALGELLNSLRQVSINGQSKYLYASAGGLYPIQTYLFVKPGRVEGVASGAYYYDPVNHRLVQIDSSAEFDREVYEPTHNRPIWDEAAFGIFFFTELQAIAPIYRDKSMHFSIIEAGLMSQLLDMAAPRQQLGLCHIGGLDHERLRSLFKLGSSHAYVYSILGGQRESGNGSTPANGAQAEDPIARIIERVQHLSAAEAQALLAAQNAKTDQNKE